MMAITIPMTIPSNIWIHNGDSTQSQLHVITPVNFSAINKIASKSQNPAPAVVDPFE